MLKAMIPAYFTAMGTMSSAATLPVALECAHKVPFLKKKSVNFCIPLFNIAHLPGAAAAITMSAMVVTILTKGQTPSLETFLPFIILLGFIEVAAVGVPGARSRRRWEFWKVLWGWISRVWDSWLPCS